MKIAHITPPRWSTRFSPGKYRMVLAHWLKGAGADTYTQRQNKATLATTYTLLDNGAFEGEQVNLDYLILAAQVLNANEVVLPDVPGEWKETLKTSQQVLGRLNNLNVGFAPQGRSGAEQLRCLKSWMDYWGDREQFLSLCIPSLRDKDGIAIPGSKTKTLLEASKYGVPIHLLGIADVNYFATDLLPKALELGVRGVDSSLAFALGARNILLTVDAPKHRLGDPKQYNKLSQYQRRLITLNRKILEGWVTTGETRLGEQIVRETSSRWLQFWA